MAPSYGSCRTDVQESKKSSLPQTRQILLGVASLALAVLVLSASSISKAVELSSAPKISLWGAGDAREERPLKQNDTSTVGDIIADETIDGFDTPLVDVAHANCTIDTDPDCQNSISPFFDKQNSGGRTLARKPRSVIEHVKMSKPTKYGLSAKAASKEIANIFYQPVADRQHYRTGQLSASNADNDIQQFFADQSALASTPQKKSAAATPAKPHSSAPPKFGLSDRAARQDFDKYFSKEATFPPAAYVGFSKSAADADLKSYFSQQLQALPQIKHARADGRGMTSKVAQQDMNHYFNNLQNKGANALPQSPPRDAIFQTVREHEQEQAKHSLSTAAATADIRSYFAKQAKLAAEPRHAQKPTQPLAAHTEAAPKFGASGAAARRDLQKYFADQQPAAAHGEKHGLSTVAARRAFDEYFAKHAPKAAVAAKTARQTLASYGVGAEDDNAIEVGKAYGLGTQQPGPPVFQSNQAPNDKLIQEVNAAIDAQRIEGYSNGNGSPVESIVFPPA